MLRPPMEITELIERLRDSRCYPDPPERVEVRQTHASVVFLAGDHAYKLKKPVNFGFLDFSTLERRDEMCRREVELNRRLAPDVYLGVEVLLERGGELRIGGSGTVVDYLVDMRRLPDEDSMAALVASGRASRKLVEGVADLLARFHLHAERGPRIDAFGMPAAIAGNVEENFVQVAPFVGETLDRLAFEEVRDWSRRFLAENDALLRARVSRGCTRDGHGDLRAEHVYVTPEGIAIIDCIEFNERFRHADVAADVAFLAMDLRQLGARDLEQALIERYRAATPFAIEETLDFYRCYRAFVRGKVASFRTREPEIEAPDREAAAREARRHFELAREYARSPEAAARRRK